MTDDLDRDSREDEQLDARWREDYRAPLDGESSAARRTLARVRQQTRRTHGLLAAWLAPRTLSVPPALGVATALALLACGAWLGVQWRAVPGAAPAVTALRARPEPAADGADATVTFVLRAPGATRVTVAGDFNGWDAEATPLARAGSGDTWTVVVAIPRGVHYYSFVLDGADWRPDPFAPLAPAAAFGAQNSVLVVNDEGTS